MLCTHFLDCTKRDTVKIVSSSKYNTHTHTFHGCLVVFEHLHYDRYKIVVERALHKIETKLEKQRYKTK